MRREGDGTLKSTMCVALPSDFDRGRIHVITCLPVTLQTVPHNLRVNEILKYLKKYVGCVYINRDKSIQTTKEVSSTILKLTKAGRQKQLSTR
jgi:hypothetical protein